MNSPVIVSRVSCFLRFNNNAMDGGLERCHGGYRCPLDQNLRHICEAHSQQQCEGTTHGEKVESGHAHAVRKRVIRLLGDKRVRVARPFIFLYPSLSWC